MTSDANLVLRERSGPMRVRVNWPPPDCGVRNPVLVFLSTDDEATDSVDGICRALCAEACVVVLSVRTACGDTAATALEWAADHAKQLEADPGAVLLGGVGKGATLAAQVAYRARESGWPVLAGDVLFVDGGQPIADVARALRIHVSSGHPGPIPRDPAGHPLHNEGEM